MPDCRLTRSPRIRRKGTIGLPRFRCGVCGKRFNRRSGTLFTRNRDIERQRKLMRYLTLPCRSSSFRKYSEPIRTGPAKVS